MKTSKKVFLWLNGPTGTSAKPYVGSTAKADIVAAAHEWIADNAKRFGAESDVATYHFGLAYNCADEFEAINADYRPTYLSAGSHISAVPCRIRVRA